MLRRLRRLATALDPAGRRIRVELRRLSSLLPDLAHRVLDVGSGAVPYADLFPHHRYVTADLLAAADVRCDATSLPFASSAFDLVVCTEVLEHVPEPDATLREIRRVLTRKGSLILTTPLTWGVHEALDFQRWTEAGLRQVLARNGFTVVQVTPRGGVLLCIGAMLLVIPWHLFGGAAERDRWRTLLYVCSYALLMVPALLLAALDSLDHRRYFTQGYAALCARDEPPPALLEIASE